MFDELGRKLTLPQAAKASGISEYYLRKNYTDFRGFVFGGSKRVYFYEQELKDAIQERCRSMGRTGDDRQEKALPPVQNKERSNRVGGEEKGRIAQREPGGRYDDPHGIFA